MNKRMIIHLLFLFYLSIIGGCGVPVIPLPDQNEVPVSKTLPIDGTWQAIDTKGHGVFKIDRGRMYIYANYNPRVKPGMVVAKDIQQTNTSQKYTCSSGAVNHSTNRVVFGRGEFEVLSENIILFRTFPNPDVGLVRISEIRLKKIYSDAEIIPPEPAPVEKREVKNYRLYASTTTKEATSTHAYT